MSLIIEILKNVVGIGVCLLGVCALQWLTQLLLDDALPQPFQQAVVKKVLPHQFQNTNGESNTNDKLQPKWQQSEGNDGDYCDKHYATNVLFFASTWAQFTLLLNSIFAKIKRLLL